MPQVGELEQREPKAVAKDRKSTRLNSSHSQISYAVFCLKKKKKNRKSTRLNSTHSQISYDVVYLQKKKHVKFIAACVYYHRHPCVSPDDYEPVPCIRAIPSRQS